MVHVVTAVVIFMWHEINGKNSINKHACCILNENSCKVVIEGEILGCVKAEEAYRIKILQQKLWQQSTNTRDSWASLALPYCHLLAEEDHWQHTGKHISDSLSRVRINWKLDYTISGEITAGLLLCSKARFDNADRAQRKLSRMLLWSKTSFSILTVHVLPLEWIKSFFFLFCNKLWK